MGSTWDRIWEEAREQAKQNMTPEEKQRDADEDRKQKAQREKSEMDALHAAFDAIDDKLPADISEWEDEQWRKGIIAAYAAIKRYDLDRSDMMHIIGTAVVLHMHEMDADDVKSPYINASVPLMAFTKVMLVGHSYALYRGSLDCYEEEYWGDWWPTVDPDHMKQVSRDIDVVQKEARERQRRWEEKKGKNK